MQIDLVMFDLGKVLVDFDFKKAVAQLKHHSPLSEKAIHDFFHHTPLWDAFEKGKVSPQTFFEGLEAALKLEGLSFKAFEHLWNDIFVVNPDSVDLLRRLKRRYRTALISNVNVLHWEHIARENDFTKWFDHPVLSYVEGCRKPEETIYRIALARGGVTPERSVFVDDIESHITAAKALGIHAVQFHNAKQLSRDWAHLLDE